MSTAERESGNLPQREILATLDVKSEDRQPILNDELATVIGRILGQVQPVKSHTPIYSRWYLETPDGKIIDLHSYATRLGRVGSADFLAHDSVSITYKEDGRLNTTCMEGISNITQLTHVDGTVSVEFVQKTDKRTRLVEVSNKGVVVSEKKSERMIPQRYIRNFSFS